MNLQSAILRALLLTVFLSAKILAADSDTIPGQAYFGRNHYIEYIAGDLPIIISVPHGGGMTPAEIPNRTYGSSTSDMNTIPLGNAVAEEMFKRFGGHPHLIICHLGRTKLDANREIAEAAQGNPWAEQAWHEWHAYLTLARARVIRKFGRGHYVDLHGHGHPIARMEIGYLLDTLDLNQDDAHIVHCRDTSSIRTLPDLSGAPFTELLRGQTSFGGMMQAAGYPSIPSPQYPYPGKGPYFFGSYNVQSYGSRNGGAISGFLLETPNPGVRDSDANRKRFAATFTKTLGEYLKSHYKMDIANFPAVAWDTLPAAVAFPAGGAKAKAREGMLMDEGNRASGSRFDVRGKRIRKGIGGFP